MNHHEYRLFKKWSVIQSQLTTTRNIIEKVIFLLKKNPSRSIDIQNYITLPLFHQNNTKKLKRKHSIPKGLKEKTLYYTMHGSGGVASTKGGRKANPYASYYFTSKGSKSKETFKREGKKIG